MRHTMPRVFALGILALALTAAAPPEARAQGFISPFMGFDYGGDSGCPTASGCEDQRSNIGVAFGSLGAVGFEAEIGFARHFFGETEGTSSNVLTFMSNLLIAPKIGPVRPYVAAGLGLIKTRVELTAPGLLETTNNNLGWDFAGGVMVFFGDHIGVRGDIRRFSTFQNLSIPIPGLPSGDEKLSFQRASAALVFAF